MNNESSLTHYHTNARKFLQGVVRLPLEHFPKPKKKKQLL